MGYASTYPDWKLIITVSTLPNVTVNVSIGVKMNLALYHTAFFFTTRPTLLNSCNEWYSLILSILTTPLKPSQTNDTSYERNH
jgi:hypothetical protein